MIMRSPVTESMNVVVIDPETRGELVRRLTSPALCGALCVVGQLATIPLRASWPPRVDSPPRVDVVVLAVHERPQPSQWRSEVFRSIISDSHRLQALFPSAAILLVHAGWTELEESLSPFRRTIRGGCEPGEYETLLLLLKNLGARITDAQIAASEAWREDLRSSRPWPANAARSGGR
jgi:hypothetical protein